MSSVNPLIPRCNTLIFDIGDVLFTWSPTTPTSIPPRTLRAITVSPTWGRYERGKISQEECYRLIAQEYNLDAEEVALAFQYARESLQSNDTFITFIRHLKAEMGGNLRVFAMSNISHPDYEYLRTKEADWFAFDRIFTSAAAGMRKPSLCFYKYVLDAIGSDPQRTVFVDDKPENVLSARSLGLHGVVFDDQKNVRTMLRYLVCDPIHRGRTFLNNHAGQLDSVTDTGILVEDNFAQLLILELTGQRELVNIARHGQSGKWNFFRGKPILTTEEFPFDLDTTSIGMTIMEHNQAVVNAVMNEMLQFHNDDGIIQTYFDRSRAWTDPVVCVNVLSLFYTHGRGSELAPTEAWVLDVLRHHAYLDGTRYYSSAESFLYFLSRLLRIAGNDSLLSGMLRPLLEERLEERMGTPGDAMALGTRVIACASVGIHNLIDLRRLLALQREDGSWEPGSIYKYGSSGISIGNSGLATALALQAVQTVLLQVPEK